MRLPLLMPERGSNYDMRDIKTKQTDNAPRVMTDAARAPKELARRSLLSAKEQAKEAAEQQQTQSEQPEQYAEERVERTADDAVHRAGDEAVHRGKQLARKASDLRKQHKEAHRGTEQNRSRPRAPSLSPEAKFTSSFSSPESSAAHQGRERIKRSFQSSRRARQASQQTAKQGAKATKTVAKGTVKTAQRTVKTAQHTVKTAEKAVKTTQQAAKAAQKTAQAAARAAQMAAKAARAAAKAAVAAAKAAAKAIAAIVKAIIAAVKALIAAIAAGGWVAVVISIVVVLVVGLLAVFGVFSSNESADGGKPMTEAIEGINAEFKTAMQTKISELSVQTEADVVEVIYEGDMESAESPVPNWADVIGVYSARVGMDEQNPADVTVVTPENIEKLREIFLDMNSVSYRTETETETITVTDEYGAIVLDENGDPMTESKTTLYIYVNVSSMDYRDGADMYRFNADQNEMLTELMRPDYYPLFAELLGDAVGDGGEYGFGLDINPDLPPNELGAQIVQAAKRYIGRSYSSMDCSGLVRAAYRDCGLSSMNGLTSTGMAQECRDIGVLFTDPSRLQAGDLIFFARKDASRGAGYCTDHRRCGSGRCKRWMQIHHVAIYINGEFLIDSTGGSNSVQIRKHWGKNGSEWEWVCFGRPTT